MAVIARRFAVADLISLNKNYRLSREVEPLAAADVATCDHVVHANHVGTGLREMGAVVFV